MDFEYYQTTVKQSSTFPIDRAWGQGRSAFGGLTAALVLTHIEQQTGLTDRDLRTINTVSYTHLRLPTTPYV